MNFRLRELNHRQLASKMKADLSAIERNIDILYVSGNDATVLETDKLSNLAESLEVFAERTYREANNVVINNNENILKDLVVRTPRKATRAEDYV